jgi:hypothetical protein
MGNEILADRVSLSDIASNALGELNSGSPSFLLRTRRALMLSLVVASDFL